MKWTWTDKTESQLAHLRADVNGLQAAHDALREAISSLRGDLQRGASNGPPLDWLRRLESLETRFADLHGRLTETSPSGRTRLTGEGSRAKRFLFGGASPGYVPPGMPSTLGQLGQGGN